MGNVRSTLTMQLLNQVSGPAAKVRRDLQGLDAAARRAQGNRLLGVGTGTAIVAGGGHMLAGALGAYATGSTAVDGYRRFADLDRRMTRIRQTADATVGETERARIMIRRVADETGLAVSDVTAGVEDLVAAGRSLPDTMAFLPAVAKTAQASGAEVSDIARTADAIGYSMKIAGSEMSRAFDVLVTQGKAGKFELKDMARYLPSLAPAAAAVGMRGVEGLNKLAAMLQTVRQQTGSAEEAAAAMTNVFQKMETEETAKKFTKFGVDLRKEMAKARQEGKDLTEVFLDLSERALKGDLSKLPQLFADQQFATGMRALLGNRQGLRAFIAEIAKAGGAVSRDLQAPATDAASAIQRLANAWEGALASFGKAADAGGVTGLLKLLGETADGAAQDFEKIGLVIQAIREFRLADAGQGAAEFIGGVTPESRREAARQETLAIGRALGAEAERSTKALAERRRLDVIMARYPKGQVPAVIQAQSDAVDVALRDAASRVEEAWRSVSAKLTDAVVRSLPPLPELRGTPDLADGDREASRLPLAPGQLPGPPRRKPEPLRSDLIVQLDDASATAAANDARAKVQRILDANPPVIRPRVEMPAVPSGGFAPPGNYGDNGGRR